MKVVLSDGSEVVVEALPRFLDLVPQTVTTNEDPENLARIIGENFDRIAEAFNQIGGPDSHPRDIARLFGGLYIEGFITDDASGIEIPHELGRRPYVVFSSGNIDGGEGYVHAVSVASWTSETVRVRSTVSANYFCIMV